MKEMLINLSGVLAYGVVVRVGNGLKIEKSLVQIPTCFTMEIHLV